MSNLTRFAKTVLFTTLFLGSIVAVRAQENPEPEPAGDQLVNRRDSERPNLLRELGLTQDQIRQVRQMNIERRPLVEAATRRLREANRDLDQAIYADQVDEENVRARVQEFQSAQNEVVRLRFSNEFAVRKILTSEQLVRFRDMRRRFAEMRRTERAERRELKNPGRIRPMNQLQRRRPN